MAGEAVAGKSCASHLDVVDKNRNIERSMDVNRKMDVIVTAAERHRFATPSGKTVGECIFKINMTRRTKSGLDKTILASNWGRTKVFLQYKTRRQGKLVVDVPPFFSSQKCAVCGHIHQDNRMSQSEFVCKICLNSDHANRNAATAIAMRGVKQLLAGMYSKKEAKQCGILKRKVEAEGAESFAVMQSPLGKTAASGLGGNILISRSLNREARAAAPTFGA